MLQTYFKVTTVGRYSVFTVHTYALDLNDLLNMELIFRLIGKPFSPGPLPHHACQIIFFHGWFSKIKILFVIFLITRVELDFFHAGFLKNHHIICDSYLLKHQHIICDSYFLKHQHIICDSYLLKKNILFVIAIF